MHYLKDIFLTRLVVNVRNLFTEAVVVTKIVLTQLMNAKKIAKYQIKVNASKKLIMDHVELKYQDIFTIKTQKIVKCFYLGDVILMKIILKIMKLA